MFEIQSSELALQKATDAKVKDFAKMMVNDHRAASDKLKSTVQSAQLPPPPTVDAKHEEDGEAPVRLGREFDRAYVDAQLKDTRKRSSSSRTTPRKARTPSSRISRSRPCRRSSSTQQVRSLDGSSS